VQVTAHDVFIILMWLGFTYLWVPPTWWLMGFITPKRLVERYFKAPHFSRAELSFMSFFPGNMMRTGIFMASTFQERYRRGRKLSDYLKYTPRWYVNISKWFVILSIAHFFLMISLLVGLCAYAWLFDVR